MSTLVQYIAENKAVEAVNVTMAALKNKTMAAIEEARKQVAAEVFEGSLTEAAKHDDFDALHNAALAAGYKHTRSDAAPTAHKNLTGLSDTRGTVHTKSPEYHTYEHPTGHSMSVSVNRGTYQSPVGAQKKNGVNGFFHAAAGMDDRGEGASSGTTVKEFNKFHTNAEAAAKKLGEDEKPAPPKKKMTDAEREAKWNKPMPWPKPESRGKSAITGFTEDEKASEKAPKKKMTDAEREAKWNKPMPWPKPESRGKSAITGFTEDEVAEGLGIFKKGRHQAITPFKGSAASPEGKAETSALMKRIADKAKASRVVLPGTYNHKGEQIGEAEAPQAPRGPMHKTLTSNGWSYAGTQSMQGAKTHSYTHPTHGNMATVHGEGATEWFYGPKGKQNTHAGSVKQLAPFVDALEKIHAKAN